MDFFEHQHQAKKKTKKLVFFFVLAVVLIITVINIIVFLMGNNFGQFQLSAKEWFYSPWFLAATLGTLAVIFIGSLIRSFQTRGGGQAVAKMVNARAIKMNTKDKYERRLINVVEEMSIASGMPVPALFVMDEEMGMNAFVAGLVPSDTVLVVTKGLLEKLDRQELQGVVAHEFSHIFNADMRLNVRLIAILGGILALGQLGYFLLRSMRYSSHRRRSSNSKNNQMGMVIFGAAITLLIVGYIGLFFGRLIKAAISRQREFLADASAVQYSRDSMGIANALYQIKTNGSKGSLLDSSHAEDMSHMCFGSALKFTAFSGLLATHPPIDERISTLVPGYRSKAGARKNKEQTQQNSESSFTNQDSAISSFSDSTSTTQQTTISPHHSEDALQIINSEQLVEQIGTMKPEQLEQAVVIHQSIPDKLIEAAHYDQTADLLILSIIASKSEDEISLALSSVLVKLSTKQIETIKEYYHVVKRLEPNLILPLIELSMPVLKQAESEQKKNLLACASLLITADKQIKPFEFFLYALLRKSLSQKDAGFNNKEIRKFKPVLEDIEYLLAVLISASGHISTTAVATAMKSFDAKWQVSSTQSYDAYQLDKSLKKLNQLAPLLKKPLMQTLAEIVIQDGKITNAEIELIRSVGIYLECPVPPLQ
jgi:Zn-dependent protease with chaperone function